MSDAAYLRRSRIRLLGFDRLHLRPERVASDEAVKLHVLAKAN